MALFGKKQEQEQTNDRNFDTGTKTAAGDAFDQIGNAEGAERSSYPIPGVYPVLYCERLKMIQSKMTSDDMFIAEFSILDSNVEGRPRGSSMAWVSNLRHKPSAGNIRLFIAELCGDSLDDVDAEVARFACSDKNPCRGRLVRLEASETKTKKGDPFTVCKWSAIPEAVQKKADELRKAAGFAVV